MITAATAANLNWDPGQTAGTTGGGTGAWDLTSSYWYNGTTDTTWTNANNDTAIFGGAAGTVTLGQATTAGGLTFDIAGYTVTGSTLTLGGATPAITVNGAATDTATISSVLAGSAGLVKSGSGNLTLSGSHTYTGGTTINAGTLTLGSGGGATGVIRGTVNIASGATLAVTAGDGLGYGANRVGVINLNGGTMTANTNINNGWGLVINMTGGTIARTGSGRFSLGADGNATTNSAVNVLSSSSTATISGVITLFNNSTSNVAGSLVEFNVADGSQADDLLVSGTLQGIGGVRKTGAGTMTYGGGQTYGGGTVIDAGKISLTGGFNKIANGAVTINAGGTLSADGAAATNAHNFTTLTLNGGVLTSTVTDTSGYGNFILNGNVTVGGSSLSTISAGNIALNGLTRTFTVADSVAGSGTDLVVSSVIYGATASSNTGGIVKAGAGTMRLTGANLFAGGTTVNAGVLMTGNTGALGGGNVTVNTGGTLQVGDGSVKTVTLAAGANLVVNTGGILKLDATLGTATPAVTLAGTGGFTFSGTLDLAGVFNGATDGSGFLVIAGGSGTKNAAGTTITGYSGPLFASLDNAGYVTFTSAVPEPSAYGILGAGALAVAACVRRRRKAA